MSVLNCKNCKNEFHQYNSIQKLCFDCTVLKAKQVVKVAHEKKWRKDKSEMKEKLKTVTEYRNDARKIFQRWIRIRDLGKNCISCETLLTDIRDYDAGHYYPANHANTLFNEINTNGQCVHCNQHKHGNLIEYRKGLIARYGNDVLFDLEKLAEDKRQRTLSKEYYIEIETKYKLLGKELEK